MWAAFVILILVTSVMVVAGDMSPPAANAPPIANIGPDQTIREGQSVKLDARNSTDPDDNITLYKYNFGDGSGFVFVPSLPRDTILIYSTADTATDNYLKVAFDTDLVSILTDHGYKVDLTDRYETPTLESSLLDKYGQLWIINGDFDTEGDFTANEVDLVLNFVHQGRGLFLISDHGGGTYEAIHDVNQIGQHLGLLYYSRVNQGPNGGPISPTFTPHEVTNGLVEICGHSTAARMNILDTSEISVLATFNSAPLMAVRDDDIGKVLFDNTLVRFMNENFELPMPWVNVADTPQYMRNAADFLAPENNTTPPIVEHKYGDDGKGIDGVYTVTLTLTDENNETSQDQMIVTVQNAPPQTVSSHNVFTFRNVPTAFNAQASDEGSDDLIFTWDFGDGSPSEQSTFYNDGINTDPYPSPGPTYPFARSDSRTHVFANLGTYLVNLTVEDDDGGVNLSQVVVQVMPFLPPTNLTTIVEGNDIVLDWRPSPSVGVDQYWIYSGQNPISVDFSLPSAIVSSLDLEWRDTGAAILNGEKYYTVRAHNVTYSLRSRTSNSAGKFTKEFHAGLNAFSLPLEPFDIRMVSEYADEIPSTLYVRWLDAGGEWVTHFKNMAKGEMDTRVEIGKAYELMVSGTSTYTFCGHPGGMINFTEGFASDPGFLYSLSAGVNGADVDLQWSSVSGAVGYFIVRSPTRGGLFDHAVYTMDYTTSTSWSDAGILSTSMEQYYFVIPVDGFGELGSSSYSVGIQRLEFKPGSDTFALPLNITGQLTLDTLCDLIQNTVGMSYVMSNVWKFHSKEMPQGVYDSDVVLSDGFQISIESLTPEFWTFVGY